MKLQYLSSTGAVVQLSSQTLTAEKGVTQYLVQNDPAVIAHIYAPDQMTASRAETLNTMLRTSPLNQPPMFTWVQALLYVDNNIAGFISRRLPPTVDIFDVVQSISGTSAVTDWDQKTRYEIARTIMTGVQRLHSRGHCLGALRRKTIVLTDNDAVWFTNCAQYAINANLDAVIKRLPFYTAPELQTEQSQVALPTHDLFSVVTLVFQLLMDGQHPFVGSRITGQSDTPNAQALTCIRDGVFPYVSNGLYVAPPHAPEFGRLPRALQRLFVRTYIDGHHDPKLRPSATEWTEALDKALQSLVRCTQNPDHWYPKTLTHCPMCTQAKKQPAPTAVPRQIPMPVMASAQQSTATSSTETTTKTVMAKPQPLFNLWVFYSMAANIGGHYLALAVPVVFQLLAIGLAARAHNFFRQPNPLTLWERVLTWLSISAALVQIYRQISWLLEVF